MASQEQSGVAEVARHLAWPLRSAKTPESLKMSVRPCMVDFVVKPKPRNPKPETLHPKSEALAPKP